MKTILVDAVLTFVDEGGHIFADMQSLLDALPNRKIILTGADDEQFQRFGLDRMPYEVFTLKHSPEKSDPAYYRQLLEHFNLSADDVVYFEHDPDAVSSAASLGIKSYQYDSDTKDLHALALFLHKALQG